VGYFENSLGKNRLPQLGTRRTVTQPKQITHHRQNSALRSRTAPVHTGQKSTCERKNTTYQTCINGRLSMSRVSSTGMRRHAPIQNKRTLYWPCGMNTGTPSGHWKTTQALVSLTEFLNKQ
jgi:hypothetical protein